MKKSVLAILCSCFFVGIVAIGATYYKKSSGGHAGSTGAPGDKTCADAQTGCHADASVLDGSTVNSLKVLDGDVEVKRFEANKTYNVKIRVEESTGKRFGFELVALDDQNNNAGTLAVGSVTTTRTQLLNFNSRRYLTHTTNGIQPISTGVNEWIMNWTSPATSTRPVTFYYCTNVTNGDLKNTGDKIYLSNSTIQHVTSGVNDESASVVSCYPNPVRDMLNINISNPHAQYVSYKLFDSKGRLVYISEANAIHNGTTEFAIPQSIVNGMYLLQVNDGWRASNQRIVVSK